MMVKRILPVVALAAAALPLGAFGASPPAPASAVPIKHIVVL